MPMFLPMLFMTVTVTTTTLFCNETTTTIHQIILDKDVTQRLVVGILRILFLPRFRIRGIDIDIGIGIGAGIGFGIGAGAGVCGNSNTEDTVMSKPMMCWVGYKTTVCTCT